MPSQIDRYDVKELLGSGSFAAVYRAYDPALDADVAIKVLADHHSAVHDVRERFIREARLLRRLASDRLVTVHDIGEWRGQPYLVMEAVAGGSACHPSGQL
jgi:eukaryotic-like serine/threonine-protein kinase